MVNDNCSISIILPVHNARSYLAECLDSIVSQTFKDWELIAVDDGSSDGSGEMLEGYAAKDARIRVVHKKNEGVSAARNTAMSLAVGEWITFIDSDDLYATSWLSKAMSIARSYGVDVVRLSACYGNKPPENFGVDTLEAESSYYDGKDCAEWCWRTFPQCGFLWRCFIRRELTFGCRFHDELTCKEDSIWLLGLVPMIRNVCDNGYTGYFYRRVDGSLTKKKRSVAQCCAYLNALLALWTDQSKWLYGNGLVNLARRQLRFCAAHDVVEWIENGKMSDVDDPKEVSKAYRSLVNSGALDCEWNGRTRYKLAFAVWTRTGWRWPIQFVYYFIWLGRLFSRR